MTDWLEVLELAREEHAELVFDGEIAYVDEGECGLIVFNRDAPVYHLPKANSLAITVH